MYQKGRAWIELNLNNLTYNVRQFQKLLPASCTLMPAVKANAYGHGAPIIARALENMGICDFCVASVGEGIELRDAGITGQILILGYTSPHQFPELSRYRLTQTLVDYEYARALHQSGLSLDVHVGIDTGMHRLGERSENIETLRKIWQFQNLNITGVFSHLCTADGATESDRAFARKQIASFDASVAALRAHGCSGFKTHMQGSYGVLNYPGLRYDFARVGIALYGAYCAPTDETEADLPLRPVLSLKSRIECVKELHPGESIGYGLTFTAAREMQTAAVSIGYADGVPRALSNRGHVLVNGRKAPIIGRICMDQLLIDVSGAPHVMPGDEVVLIGKSGRNQIAASELADRTDTIANEILSRLGNRLERIATAL